MSTNNANNTSLGTADPYNAQQIAYVASATSAFTETNGQPVQTANNIAIVRSKPANLTSFRPCTWRLRAAIT